MFFKPEPPWNYMLKARPQTRSYILNISFELTQPLSWQYSNMAASTRFERVTNGLTIRCSTN